MHVEFYNVNFSYSNLYQAILSNIHFLLTNLSYVNLSYSDLSDADLSYDNLCNANLSYANLSSANLFYADLPSANLSGCMLSKTRLENARLNNSIMVTLFDYDFSCKDADFADSVTTLLPEYLHSKQAKNVPEKVYDRNQFKKILAERRLSRKEVRDLLDLGYTSSHPPE